MASRVELDFYLEMLERLVTARGGDPEAEMAPYRHEVERRRDAPGQMVALGEALPAASSEQPRGDGDIVPVPAGLGAPRQS